MTNKIKGIIDYISEESDKKFLLINFWDDNRHAQTARALVRDIRVHMGHVCILQKGDEVSFYVTVNPHTGLFDAREVRCDVLVENPPERETSIMGDPVFKPDGKTMHFVFRDGCNCRLMAWFKQGSSRERFIVPGQHVSHLTVPDPTASGRYHAEDFKLVTGEI
jgi:hypothetical protein